MTTTEPSQPLTGFELDNIEGRWQRYVALRDEGSMETSVHDVPDLLAEVDRLRGALAAISRNERAAANRSLKLQEENDRLHAQVHDYHQSADAHVAKFERQHERLQELKSQGEAVVALHKPTDMNSWGHRTCTHCDTPGYYQEWPCPTLVALGFEER